MYTSCITRTYHIWTLVQVCCLRHNGTWLSANWFLVARSSCVTGPATEVFYLTRGCGLTWVPSDKRNGLVKYTLRWKVLNCKDVCSSKVRHLMSSFDEQHRQPAPEGFRLLTSGQQVQPAICFLTLSIWFAYHVESGIGRALKPVLSCAFFPSNGTHLGKYSLGVSMRCDVIVFTFVV